MLIVVSRKHVFLPWPLVEIAMSKARTLFFRLFAGICFRRFAQPFLSGNFSAISFWPFFGHLFLLSGRWRVFCWMYSFCGHVLGCQFCFRIYDPLPFLMAAWAQAYFCGRWPQSSSCESGMRSFYFWSLANILFPRFWTTFCFRCAPDQAHSVFSFFTIAKACWLWPIGSISFRQFHALAFSKSFFLFWVFVFGLTLFNRCAAPFLFCAPCPSQTAEYPCKKHVSWIICFHVIGPPPYPLP